MAISNEKLALLYNETDDKENKQKIFLELKNNLEEKTNKVIKFWINNFSDQHKKKEDYLNFKQMADELIIYTINVSQNMSEDFIFEKFYIRVLKNKLYDYGKDRIKIENNEILMDISSECIENLISVDNYQDFDTSIDNEYLYDIFKVYINKLKFKTNGDKNSEYYRNIFVQSIGFNEEKEPVSYAELAEQFGCTRQNIRDCCTRYTKQLIKLLEKDNKLEELRQYL
jgi:hemerythrin-like domain-containing protein